MAHARSQRVGRQIPAARAVVVRSSQPRFSGRNELGVTVTHRELVGTVTNAGVTGFALTAESSAYPGYDLSPGCGTLFPWLSTIARNFEKYQFKNLKFEFIASSPSTYSGRFYAAIDYDWNDPIATSKASLMCNRTCVEGSLWEPLTLSADVKAMHDDIPFKYVMTGTRVEAEPRTTFGGFMMCAFDTSTTNVVFDLWVSYTVELRTPQLPVGEKVDTFSTAPVENLANVVPNVGTGYARALNLAQRTVGALRVVAPGVGAVPPLTIPFGGASITPTSVVQVLDVADGILSLLTNVSENGVAPVTLIPKTDDKFVKFRAFDALGADLGVVDSGQSGYGAATNFVGPKSVTDMSAGGKSVVAGLDLPLDILKSKLPSVAYLAPYLHALAGIGAGTIAAGLKFRSEL